MTKEVLITITGTQNSPEDGENTLEVTSRGEYFFRGGKHFVVYEEAEEGSGTVIRNRVKFKQGYLETVKNGAVNATLFFETGKAISSCYETPYGSMMMETETAWVDVTESEELIEVEASYKLSMNCEFLADCRIHISVVPVKI